MKKQILISLLSLSSVLIVNAQWNGTTTNSNVGIGATSPSYQLHIKDGNGLFIQASNAQLMMSDITSAMKLRMDNSGNLEIVNAANTPIYHFDKYGNLGIGTVSPSYQLHIKDGNGLFIQASNAQLMMSDITSAMKLRMDNNGNLEITNAANTSIYHFDKYGHFGIGTTTPDYPLDVVGIIRCHRVKINLLKTADFVFSPSYKLPSLNDVEAYIKTHKHLEGIASAGDMEKNGIEVGDMQISLLQKIEELVLYTIEQNKKLEKLEAQVSVTTTQQQIIDKQNELIGALEKRIKELEASKK